MSFNMLDFRYDEIMNEAHLQLHSINNTQNSSSNLLEVKEPAINSNNVVPLQNTVNTTS
jgi:hypothetical protein